jgi:hypothetical protein
MGDMADMGEEVEAITNLNKGNWHKRTRYITTTKEIKL